jgi:hypothetical protein
MLVRCWSSAIITDVADVVNPFGHRTWGADTVPPASSSAVSDAVGMA